MRSQKNTLVLPLLVFFLLLSAYLFVFNGMASTDDEQLYAVLTENYALQRGTSALPLFGNDRLQGETGSVEPLHPLLGVPAYRLSQLLGVGKTQMLFLMPAFYTALTGAILVFTAQAQNYPKNTSLAVGLAFGLSTIAFPYARTNFREPLAGLFLTAAVYCLTSIPIAVKQGQKVLLVFASMAALVMAALTKLINAVLIPILLLLLFLQFKTEDKKDRRRSFYWVMAGLIGLAAVILGLPYLFPAANLSRFTLRFFDYLAYTLPRLPRDHFWNALSGQFFSPGKGLFIYSPVLLLSLAALFVRRKNELIKSLLYLCAPLALAVAQALIYNDEWWNITWGTRTLLPAVPLLCLAAVPVINWLLNQERKGSRAILYAFIGLGIIIQVGRLLCSDPAYVSWVVNRTGEGINSALQWRWELAPAIRHWQLGLTDKVSDIAWLHFPSLRFSSFFIFIPMTVIGLVIMQLVRPQRKKGLYVITALLSVITLMITPFAARADQRYHGGEASFIETRDALCYTAAEGDLVLVDSYLHPFWWFYSNFGCTEPQWLGLPYLHRTALGGGFYYPRTADLSRLIEDWLAAGDVYLAEIDRKRAPALFGNPGGKWVCVKPFVCGWCGGGVSISRKKVKSTLTALFLLHQRDHPPSLYQCRQCVPL